MAVMPVKYSPDSLFFSEIDRMNQSENVYIKHGATRVVHAIAIPMIVALATIYNAVALAIVKPPLILLRYTIGFIPTKEGRLSDSFPEDTTLSHFLWHAYKIVIIWVDVIPLYVVGLISPSTNVLIHRKLGLIPAISEEELGSIKDVENRPNMAPSLQDQIKQAAAERKARNAGDIEKAQTVDQKHELTQNLARKESESLKDAPRPNMAPSLQDQIKQATADRKAKNAGDNEKAKTVDQKHELTQNLARKESESLKDASRPNMASSLQDQIKQAAANSKANNAGDTENTQTVDQKRAQTRNLPNKESEPITSVSRPNMASSLQDQIKQAAAERKAKNNQHSPQPLDGKSQSGTSETPRSTPPSYSGNMLYPFNLSMIDKVKSLLPDEKVEEDSESSDWDSEIPGQPYEYDTIEDMFINKQFEAHDTPRIAKESPIKYEDSPTVDYSELTKTLSKRRLGIEGKELSNSEEEEWV